MNIDELTLGQIKQLKTMFGDCASPATCEHRFEIGRPYLFRLATVYALGVVQWVGEHEIELSSAGWVADTGRYHNCLKTGELSEYEPSPDGFKLIGRGAICDVEHWNHDMPKLVIE